MSYKWKLSLLISSIAFALLALNAILGERISRDIMHNKIAADLNRIANETSLAVTQYEQAKDAVAAQLQKLLELAQSGWLETSALPSWQALQRVAVVTGAAKVRWLQDIGEKLQVTVSSDRTTDSILLPKPSKLSQPFWSRDPGDKAKRPEEWAYFPAADGEHWIGLGLKSEQADWLAGQLQPIDRMMRIYAPIMEITVFQVAAQAGDADLVPAAGTEPANDPPSDRANDAAAVIFGTYRYGQKTEDAASIAETIAAGPVTQTFSIGDRKLVKNFYPLSYGDHTFVIRIVSDSDQWYAAYEDGRIARLKVSGALLLCTLMVSVILAGAFVRPLRRLLGAVLEWAYSGASLALPVDRKDELGRLAVQVERMARKIETYVHKLNASYEENRAMKAYLDSYIQNTTDAIYTADLEGKVTRINRSFEQLFGYRAADAMGRKLPLVPDHCLAEEQQMLEAVRAGQSPPERETVRIGSNGNRIDVSVNISPLHDRDGMVRGYVCMMRDLTNRNKMEELLRRYEKLTTVGQLAAGVAHEIRNPLTTLRGFLQLQLETQKTSPRHTEIMLSELDRINSIVSEFLVLAKPQTIKFETKDVRFIMGDVISLLDSQAHLYDIQFESVFTPQPCFVSCEKNQLKQVFVNLLKNAIESMPEGGVIEIGIGKQGDGAISVTIADEGIGIPEEMVSRLGEPFFTAKESGTGLGIMVSQRIIQNHHGKMTIRSEVGTGTTVTITLPSAKEERPSG